MTPAGIRRLQAGGVGGRDAVVGGERDPEPVAVLLLQKGEEFADLAIERERHRVHLRGVGAIGMARQVVGREADHQQVGDGALAQLFLLDQLARELEFVVIGVRRAANQFVVVDRLAVGPSCGAVEPSTWPLASFQSRFR